MKKNGLFSIVLLALCLTVSAQDRNKAMSEKSITWFGVDYSEAKFTLVTDDPTVIVNQYLKAINTLIITEVEKFDLKKFFNKTEVTPALDDVNEKNAKIDPAKLVITETYKIPPEDLQKIVKGYNTQGKTGTGLVFIAENLNKTTQTGSYYVCFFDMSTHSIIDAQPMTAKAVGIGFRNYWAGSVYNVMKTWKK
jgi:hypothetical protein